MHRAMQTAVPVALLLSTMIAFTSAQTGIMSAVIHSIYPRSGSYAGGTKLTITGKGFQREGISGTTDVHIGELKCDIIDYFSSDTRIVCVTRMLHDSDDQYPVQIALASMTDVAFSVCQDSTTECFFWYKDEATPYITQSTSSTTVGGVLEFGGYLRGLNTSMYTITVGGINCDIVDEFTLTDASGDVIDFGVFRRRHRRQLLELQPPDGDFPSVDAFIESSGAADVEPRTVLSSVWQTGSLSCDLSTELEAGHYNYTVHVSPHWSSWNFGNGDAMFSERDSSPVTRDLVSTAHDDSNTGHVLTLVPRIASLSTQISGALGGDTLVIQGHGFSANCDSNEVTVAGVLCTITSCSNTQIECTTGNSSSALTSSSPQIPGTAGVRRKQWNEGVSDLDFETSVSEYTNPDVIDTALDGWYGVYARGSNYAQEHSALFVAPYTTNYSFWVLGDDRAQLDINPAGTDFSSMTTIASMPYPTSQYVTQASQKSAPVHLVAGQRYAIRTRHEEGGGGDYMQAAVEIQDIPEIDSRFQYHRINEMQDIHISAVRISQVQTISLANITGGQLGFLNGSGYVFQVALGASIDSSDWEDTLAEVVPGCSDFDFTYSQDLAVSNTATINVIFKCTPDVTADGTGVISFADLRLSTSNLTVAPNATSVSSSVTTTTGPTLPMSGSFRLGIDGMWSEAIAWSPSATGTTKTRIQTALVAFPSIQSVEMYSWGNAGYDAYFRVIFLSPQGRDHPEIEVDTSMFRGSNVTAVLQTLQHGNPTSVVYDPIPIDFTEVYTGSPNVVVRSNNILAACTDATPDACVFNYDDAITGRVLAVSSSSGLTPTAGDTLNISGERLQYNGGTVSVTFAGSTCAVLSHSSTDITCILSHATYGSYHPVVIVQGTGEAEIDGAVSMMSYSFAVDNISPARSGYRGGTLVTLMGTGFSTTGANGITISGAPCVEDVSVAAPNRIVCVAPQWSNTTLSSLPHASLPAITTEDLIIGFFNNYSAAFEYSQSLTPSITMVSPEAISAAKTTTVTLTGAFTSGLFSTDPSPTCGGSSIRFESPSGLVRECTQLSFSVSNVTCLLVRGLPFPVEEQNQTFVRLSICADDVGTVMDVVAHPEPTYAFVDLALRIESIEAVNGSLAAGTPVVIHGQGFADDSENIIKRALTYNYETPMVVVNITLADRVLPCLLTHSNFTVVECDTVIPTSLRAVMTGTPPHEYIGGGYNGEVSVSVNGVVAPGCIDNGLSPAEVDNTTTMVTYVAGTGSFCASDVDICIYWEPGPIDTQIQFTMTTNATSGYFSMGLSDMPMQMGPSDVASCQVEGGVMQVRDRFNVMRGVNVNDGSQDLVLTSGSINVSASQSSCTFTRNIVASDLSQDRSINAGLNNVIYCMGSLHPTDLPPRPSYHGASRGGTALSFLVAQNVSINSTSGVDLSSPVAPVHTFQDVLATSCSFNYAASATPQLYSVAPATGQGATSVVLTGSGFTSQPIVFVGDNECNVTAFTQTNISCDVPPIAAGRYNFRVFIGPFGLAAHNSALPVSDHVSFTSELSITQIEPNVSSTGGGLVLTMVGNGFSDAKENNTLIIGGVKAHIIDAQHDRIVAVSPEHAVGTAEVLVSVNTDLLPDYLYGQLSPVSYSYSAGVAPGSIVAGSGTGMFVRPAQYNLSAATAGCASCEFAYSAAVTPTVTGVSPSSGFEGQLITVTGTGFVGTNITEVLIGQHLCEVQSVVSGEIQCIVGTTRAGTHAVYVTVHGHGTAAGAAAYTSLLEVSTVSQTSGSFGGSTNITIIGRGFGGNRAVSTTRRVRRMADSAWGGWELIDVDVLEEEDQELGTRITMCNQNCTVVESSYSQLVCVTPALDTAESIIAYNNNEVQQITSDSYISSHISDAPTAFDGDFTSTFNGQWVGIDLGNDTRALITKIRFFPQHQYISAVEGGVFEASLDGVSWTILGNIESPNQGWNWISQIELGSQTPARFIRYNAAGYYGRMSMLEFYGYPVNSGAACPLQVAVTAPLSHPSHGVMVTDHAVIVSEAANATFTYEDNRTGHVTSVSPIFGSSLGGERVTLKGTNLGAPGSTTEVEINRVRCVVDLVSASGDTVECVTEARGSILRHNSVPQEIIVHDRRADRGVAVVDLSVNYRFLDRWSAVNTWLNDEPPIEGDSVIVPIDQTILLDTSPPRLFLLLVQGSLVFDRTNINLDASYIFVQGGRFEVGTEDDPFLQNATITLHGHRHNSIEIPFIGAKVLAVGDRGGFSTHANGTGAEVPESQKGVLDIHGRPRVRTWTKVVPGTIPAGSNTITTSEVTDFAPGERVVLTAPHQELTVATRVDDYTFTVAEPIAAEHVSEWRNHSGAGGVFELDMRCEVALLSRNVLIQGQGPPRLDGSPTIVPGEELSSEAQLFGVHTGAFHGGYYRVENTELRHCGQAGVLGRYCLHYHVNGDNPPPDSYLKSNSIHHSFQRATTVHGTHHALVQNNVAYHVMGHTYFVEDGDETYNVFDNNIGIYTRRSHMMLKSDMGPATFWTAIPTNYWRNNIATDSEDRGAWYELVNQGVTLEFKNNSFHHNGGIGFRNYPNYSPPADQYFHNNSYFRNGGNGLFYKQGGDNHHVYSKFAENGVDIFWKKYIVNQDAVDRNIPNVQDCIFWGGVGAQAIFAPQHEFWYVNGSTFINYGATTGVLSACAGCCSANSLRQGAYTTRFERLHWINSTHRTEWTCPYKQIMYDLDGSLSGSAGGTVLPSYKFNNWTGSCAPDESNTYDHGGWAAGGMVCDNSVRVRRLQIYNNEPNDLDYKPISFKKSHMTVLTNGSRVDTYGGVDWDKFNLTGVLYEGTCISGNGSPDWIPADFSGCDTMDGLDWVNYRNCNSDYDGWAIPMVTSHDYYADLDWHIDFQELEIRWSEPEYLYEAHNLPMVDEESVLLKWPYVDYRYNFRVQFDGSWNNSVVLPWYDNDSAPKTNVTRFDNFGESFITRNDNSKRTTGSGGVLDLSLNPYAGVSNSSRDPLQLEVRALQCGPNMCGLPGDIPVTWPSPLYWSNPSTWLFIQGQSINTASVVPTGNLPVDGEHVEIPTGVYVIMDISPPRLGKLVVAGRLDFQQGADLSLHVDRMLVWGMLNIGTSSAPFTGDAEIVLRGLRTSPTLVATDQHFLGNKNLVIFGIANFYGQAKTRTWTQLDATASPGATSITTTQSISNWAVGDQIVIAGTEYPQPVDIYAQAPGFSVYNYSAHQTEERVITGISGRTISFAEPLQFRHFAGVISTSTGNVELRAHVGLLTSNVVVRGEIDDAPTTGQYWYSGYGGHIVVGEVNYGSEAELEALIAAGEILKTTQKLGSLRASWTEFRNMGKLASEHGAIVYRYFSDLKPSEYPTNFVSNCMFPFTWNHAMSTEKAFGIEFTQNSVHKTFKSGIEIDLESRDISVDYNLVVGNQRSVDDFNNQCFLDRSCWQQPFSAYAIENQHMASFTNNVAANSEDTGFTIIPQDNCNVSFVNRVVRNNEAYGSLVGVLLLDTVRDACFAVGGTKSWKNAHIGIATIDQMADLVLDFTIVSDNHEGISLNFVKRGINSFSSISNSYILGSTAASTCSASLACRAQDASDVRGLGCNSEFRSSWRRVGLVLPQYTNLPKTCQRAAMAGGSDGQSCRPLNTVNRMCSLPLENRFGNVDVQYAEMNVTQTTFAYWATNDCSMTSRAIAINPSQPDMTPMMFFGANTWENYDNTSRFVLDDTSQQRHEATACVDSCDAINYMTIHDLDGSTHGAFVANGNPVQPVTIMSAKNLPATHPDKCRTDAQSGSVVCQDYNLRRMTFEANPPRFTHRRVGPTKVTKYGADVPEETTYWSVGPFPQGCSCQKHFAQFTFDTQVGQTYEVNTTGVIENRNRIALYSNDPSECVLIKLFVDKPQPVRVTMGSEDGPEMLRLTNGSYPAADDLFASGTSTLNPQERQLHLKLCGGMNKVYWLVYENRIMVTAVLAMTADEFFANDAGLDYQAGTESFTSNLALLLGISPSQIKVTCVHPVGQVGSCFGASSFSRRERRQIGNETTSTATTVTSTSATSTSTTTTPGLVVDFTVEPNYTTPVPSTVGNDTVYTDESTTEEQQQQQLLALYGKLSTDQGSIISGMASFGYVILSLSSAFDVSTSTTPEAGVEVSTTDDPNLSSSESSSGISTAVVAAAAAAATVALLIVIYLIVFLRRRNRNAQKEEKYSNGTTFNPKMDHGSGAEFYVTADTDDFVPAKIVTTSSTEMDMEPDFEANDEPAFKAGNRAILQQDSLIRRKPKKSSSGDVSPDGGGYYDIAPGETDVRPSALQHTEDPKFSDAHIAPMGSERGLQIIRGSVHRKPAVNETDRDLAGYNPVFVPKSADVDDFQT